MFSGLFDEKRVVVFNGMDEVMEEVVRSGVRRVVIQAPLGLRRTALSMVDVLERAGVTALVMAEPCFGACDLADHQASLLGAEVLIQLGHSPIPDMRPVIPTVFAELRSEYDPSSYMGKSVLNLAIEYLESPVGLTATLQYVDTLAKIRERLESKEIECIIGMGRRTTYAGQVLGCDISSATSIADRVNSFLHIGSGTFHALGVAVATRKPTILLNPETGKVERMNVEEFLRIRYGIVSKAMNARRMGILIGLKAGQMRFHQAEEVRLLLERRGIRTYLLPVDVVTPEILHSFGLDAYISTLCPRIALDDQATFDVPVLTLTEALLLLDLDAEYEFDQMI